MCCLWAKTCASWRLEATVSTLMDKGKAKDVTYLGYWKVCDMIPNNIIPSKFERYGFDGWTLVVFKEKYVHPFKYLKNKDDKSCLNKLTDAPVFLGQQELEDISMGDFV
ncbi:hypothetical protein DUI87_12823 [Hirundo rustica rustica]|uniref:Uncharacterized protein n=1 Tax=Hirundo rustica rustica TaxID=333673 RepID=A0A3M0KA14_HIRRU|nr:hypothetical protein DUI87_12823 [Hirundo rustica rustica]